MAKLDVPKINRKDVAQFGASPKLTKADEIEPAIALLRVLRVREATVSKIIEDEVAKLRQQYADELTVSVDGEELPLAAFARRLEEAVTAFAWKQRKKLFKEERTLTFDAGRLLLRTNNTPSVEVEGDASAIVEQIVESKRATSALEKLRSKLAPLVRVNVGLDKQGIKGAHKAETVSSDELAEFGLALVQPQSIKVELDERPQNGVEQTAA